MSNKPPKSGVGYCRPPHESRFKPGQSGNPKGRPKLAGNIALEILTELKRPVTVRENGQERTMTKKAALAKSIVSRALAGDVKSVQLVMKSLPGEFRAPEGSQAAPTAPVSALEAEILERFVARRLGNAGASPNLNEQSTADADEPDTGEMTND